LSLAKLFTCFYLAHHDMAFIIKDSLATLNLADNRKAK